MHTRTCVTCKHVDGEREREILGEISVYVLTKVLPLIFWVLKVFVPFSYCTSQVKESKMEDSHHTVSKYFLEFMYLEAFNFCHFL